MTVAIQLVIQNIGQFNGEDIRRFLVVYENEMTNKGATGVNMVAQFNSVDSSCSSKGRGISRKILHLEWISSSIVR